MYNPTNSRDTNGASLAQECAVANTSETYKSTWGWSDVRCTNKHVYICRRIRKPHNWQPLRCTDLTRPAVKPQAAYNSTM